MQVSMLGSLEVRTDDGAPVGITGARLRTVLVRLAVDAGHPVAPGTLVDAVWGDAPPADAANALQTLVSRLRRALGGGAPVQQTAAGYRLAVDPDDVDALRFQSLVRDGALALREDDAVAATQLLGGALALWRGPLPEELVVAAPAAAARLADLRVAAVVDRVAAELQLGTADTGVPDLEALSAEHPLDERIAVHLVTALAAAGRQADALRAYERVRERLADELGVDPSADLRAAHLAVLRGEVAGVSELRDAGRARRTNLKAPLTSFVGREDETVRVAKALDENRLVTVVGPGGAGKTRLASEVGATLAARDGVWLAELAPVSDPAAVPQAVLAALGFRDRHVIERRPSPGLADTHTRLLDALGDKDAVLVLDNCEHLIDAAAALAEHLLQQCPHLRVLATSREPLAITGEVVLALPTLGRPAADTPAAFAIDYPAVRLFADRAAAARSDFVLDDANVAPVIEIVRRLDGLPLAIELAAARLRTLPVADIAARLDDRFRLLTGGSRTALPRHRTLRAVVEWSWELLSVAERRLVERLSVFAAGATTDSAVAVCAGGDLSADEVADLVSSLIDKSLLQRVGDGNRVRMLETIREFGIERLDERGELADVRLRHAEYFGQLLADAEPHLTRREQLPWLDLLTAERDNIAAALRLRCSTGDAHGALSIAVGLAGFAMLLGNHGEVAGWTSEALAVPGWTDRSLRTTAEALQALHTTAVGTTPAGIDDAMAHLHETAGRLDLIESGQHPMNSVLRVAVAYFTNDVELTKRVLEEELSSPDEWVRATTRMFRANLAENNGELEAMRDDVDGALDEFRAIGERWGLANTLRSKALLLTMDGDLAGAEAAYAEALELMAELKSREDEAFLLVRIAELALRRGDVSEARDVMLRAYEAAELAGDGIESVFVLSMLSEFERRAGDLDRARELHGEAMGRIANLPASHPAQSHGRAMVYALAARFAFGEGDLAGSARLAGDAFTAAVATRDNPIVAAVGVVLAEIAASAGRPDTAAAMLGATARLRGGDDPTAPDVLALTTQLRARLGADEFAARYADGKSLDAVAARRRLDPVEALSGVLPSR